MTTAAFRLPGGEREYALRRLELIIRRRLDGLLHGDHTGLLPGHGTEPDETRLYRPGEDDVRRMDWNVTARTQQPHVRVPIAERELQTWALIDASASMDFGTALMEKRDLAVAVVSAIGFITSGPGNQLGVRIAYGDQLDKIPARAGTAALRAILRALWELPRAEPGQHPDTDLATAIERLDRDHRRPGLRVVCSDFLDATPHRWAESLRRLSHRHDVIAVEVVDPREYDLPDIGMLSLVDPETGRRREIHANRRLRERYSAAALEHRATTARAFRDAGVGHLVLSTDRDWVVDVARFVLARRRAHKIRSVRR